MTVEDLLRQYKRYLLKIAWDYVSTAEDAQELAQEGWIAMWEAHRDWTEQKGVPLHTHIKNKARWRMTEVARRGTYTGRSSSNFSGAKKARKLEVPLESQDPATEQDVDSILMAYHTGEIVDAINSLPPKQRQQVYDRFWRGCYDPHNANWWYRGARGKLRERLGHLTDTT